MEQQAHEHRRGDQLPPHMAGGELCAAVAALTAGEQIAEHRHQIPDAQHMAADVAVGAPPENGLPVDGAPRQTGQKAARTGAQQGRHRAAVNGDERRQAQHDCFLLGVVFLRGGWPPTLGHPLSLSFPVKDEPSAETAHPRRKGAFPRRSDRSGEGSEKVRVIR